MCQGPRALKRLAEVEQAGAIAINSALSIRNCYRDLLAAGLESAGVPTPVGALVPAHEPLDARKLTGLDLSAGVFVKRGDLHALAPEDVQRAADRAEVESILADFARRGIRFAYLQQEVVGRVVKFYGVSGGSHFSVHPEDEEIPEAAVRALSEAANAAAACARPRGVGRRRGLEWRSFCDYRFQRLAQLQPGARTCRSRHRAPCDKSARPHALDSAPEIQTRNRTAIN